MSVATLSSERKVPWYIRWDLTSVIPGVLLAALMLWSVTESLIRANWAEGMQILLLLALPGLLIGVLFARLSWLPGWLAHSLAAALGLVWTVQRIGPVLTAQVAREHGSTLAVRLNSWTEWASELMLRLVSWLRIIQAGGRGEDVVLFVLVVGLIMWTLGYLTGWMLFRSGRIWLAVVMSATVILINYTFILPKPTNLFFLFLLAAMLVIVYQHVISQQSLWRAAQIEVPGWLAWRSVSAAALFCGLLIGLTGFIPGTVTSSEAQQAWRIIRSPFTSMRESWQDAFSTINAPPGTSGSFATRGVRVGGPRTLGDAIVMHVRSAKYEYWRAVAFDKYTGHNWQNTVGERARATLGLATAEQARTFLNANEAIAQTELRARDLITQTITLDQTRSDSLVIMGGQFHAANVPTLVQHGVLLSSQGQPVPNYTELSSVTAEVPLEATTTYTVSGYISTVDERSLREAGTGYPDWIKASYLQLPDTLPPRVRERAQEIVQAAGAATAYDQAVAIEQALRGLTYDEQRPTPPDERDWVDYFLFDAKRGYCDDFASAMVVMLRAQRIPARWVQGYAGGTLDPDSGLWVVRESVAHSWVEVYFPTYGWQRFEPTPAPYAIAVARPAEPFKDDKEGDTITPSDDVSNQLSDPEEIMRRLREMNEELESQGGGGSLDQLLEAQRAEARRQQLLTIGTILSALVLLLSAGWLWLRLDLRGLSPAAIAYARMARLAGWAGMPLQASMTPREYADQLSKELPQHQGTVNKIANSFLSERYRPEHKAETVDASQWAELRQSLLGRMFKHRFGKS